jgi:nitrate/nitrite transporter NarK
MKTNVIASSNTLRIVLAVATLLLIPLVAMQFSDEVNWTAEDFVVAGVLLLAAGAVFDLIVRKVHTRNRKVVAAGLLAILLFYVWAELAVGVFTNLGS